MATKPLTSQVFRSILSSGKPNSLGTVDVYVAGTAFATRATIYSDAIKTAELTNPVTLSSAGEIEIWFEVAVDYVVKDSSGNTIRNVLAVPASETVVSTGDYNLVTNGSAELDTDTDTLPDDWTLATETSGTITVATDSVAHGQQSFKFVGAGNGAGTATSEKFDVLEGEYLDVQFTYKTDAATSTNSLKIKWYTKADALVSTTTIYSGTTGQPSTFTTYYRTALAPATATRGEVVLGGIENGGTVETGTTYFDGVSVSQGSLFPNINAPTTVTDEEVDLLASQIGGFLLKGTADAAGTADAITADFTPDISLTDGVTVIVRASGANTITNPTFAPDGLTAKTITKDGNTALRSGDIYGADHEMLLRYNSTNDAWELLNPTASYPQSFATAYITTPDTVTMSAGGVIDFDTEYVDTDTWHDNATNPSRFTVPSSLGITHVEISAQITFSHNDAVAQNFFFHISKNGTKIHGGAAAQITGVANTEQFAFTFAPMIFTATASDYFEIDVATSAGTGTITLEAESYCTIKGIS